MIGFGAAKRLIDLFGAAILVILLLPVMVAGCVLVLVSMGRPVLFLQTRSGRNGRPFRMIKLRTMLDDKTGQMSDSERVAKTGLFLRKFSIDEIPQLFNVLQGSMSLVGPRPLLREYDERYSAEQARRLLAKPGLTGLAQVEGRNDLTWDEKLKLDVRYVDNQSIWLDMRIMLRTPLVVLSARGFRRSGEAAKFGE